MIDKEIVKGCIDNNRAAQKALYEAFYNKMMGVCLRYAQGEDDAHEMVQEGFFKVYKMLKYFKENEILEEWVKKNMIEASIKYIKEDKNQRSIVSTVYATKPGKEKIVDLTDTEIAAKAKQADILTAVQELTKGYRIVFNLYLIDGYSYKDIAEMIDVSEETARANFERAKFSFRKNLIQHLSNSNGK
jgi:RNA polymerase sigma-70 factor (ECF subfamily)